MIADAGRGRSLFWTFAGVFLLVLAVATLLQVVVLLGVLRPLAARGVRDRAEAVVARASQELAVASALEDDDVREVLGRHREETGAAWIAFRDPDGRIVFDRELPPPIVRQMVERLDGYPAPPPGRRFDGGPYGGPGPPPNGERFGELPPPDEMRRDFERRRRGGPGGPRGPGGPDGPRGPGRGNPQPIELLFKRPVTRGATSIGELAAFAPKQSAGLGWLPEARATLLFLPIAVLVSGAAGVLMVRILVRRLRALEHLAARVTAGDLTARVADPRPDEIGRLGASLNTMTEALAGARAHVEATDAERRRLLADVTHELATPLTSIKGYTETLLDPSVPTSGDERQRYLRDILGEAQRLDLLIRDLFELTRLEAGGIPLAIERLDWAALCRNTTERFEHRFRDKGLALAWTGPADGAWIAADGRRMEQVLENLLVNTLRYVPAGGTVAVALARDGARVRLCVSDDGPGISEPDLTRVFERFYRGATAPQGAGSGLGLAIVKEIVHRHGGTIRAERCAPRGTTFVIEMPAAS